MTRTKIVKLPLTIYKSIFPVFFMTECLFCNDSIQWEYMWHWISGPFYGGQGHRKHACMDCCPTKIDVCDKFDEKLSNSRFPGPPKPLKPIITDLSH